MMSHEYELPTNSDPFFRMQELMFLPKERGEEQSPKYITEVEKEIKNLKDYCSKYLRQSPKGSRTVSPRAYRIHNEYIIANLEPVLSRAAFVVGNCHILTAGRYYYVTQHYYNNLLKPFVSAETMQALTSRMCFGGHNWMSYNQEPIYFFNEKRGVIGSYDEAYYGLDKAEYKRINSSFNANIADNKCIYLKIGRFSTEEDVKWFIDNYWEKMTKGMPNTKRCEWRMTDKRLRTLLTDCMLVCGLKTGDIITIIDKVFPVLGDEYKNTHAGGVEKGTIDKARKNLKKRLKIDVFDTAYNDLLSLLQKNELSADPSKSSRRAFLITEDELNGIAVCPIPKFRVTNKLPKKIQAEITKPITIYDQDNHSEIVIQNKI